MNPYHHLVSEYARFAKEGKSYPLGKFARLPRPDLPANAPKALIFSPHPDDEVIIGGLALRLMRESGWNVINVAVTQGSKKERQAERLAELKACCDCIGFGLVQTMPNGLEKVNVKTREQDPAHWANSVNIALYPGLLGQNSPKYIFPSRLLIKIEASQINKPLCCRAISSTIDGKHILLILSSISIGKTRSSAHPV